MIEKITDIKLNSINKILLGYSFFIILSYYLYFFFRLEPALINSLIIFTVILLTLNLKNYIRFFFLTIDNLLFNLIIIILIIPTFLYGEQFYIFRGNYWDSSNYLSSAILMKNYSYDEILLEKYPYIFSKFQNMYSIVNGRPIVNYFVHIVLLKQNISMQVYV